MAVITSSIVVISHVLAHQGSELRPGPVASQAGGLEKQTVRFVLFLCSFTFLGCRFGHGVKNVTNPLTAIIEFLVLFVWEKSSHSVVGIIVVVLLLPSDF